MGSRAQSGLEYLLTYGWALVLIATIVGVAVLLFQPPAAEISFSSETRDFLVKAGNVRPGGGDDSITLVLQNLTAQKIRVNNITASGQIYGDRGTAVTLNDASLDQPVEVIAGGELRFKNLDTDSGPVKGTILIEYTDGSGFNRSVEFRASGNIIAKASVCGNGILEGSEECDPPYKPPYLGYWPCNACPFPLCTGYFSGDNSVAAKIASFSSKQDAVQSLSGKASFAVWTGFKCSATCTLINEGCTAP